MFHPSPTSAQIEFSVVLVGDAVPVILWSRWNLAGELSLLVTCVLELCSVLISTACTLLLLSLLTVNGFRDQCITVLRE